MQILCCDTMVSNTDHINYACMLLEQKFNRELFIFACHHHVYKLVLKSVFKVRISEVTTSPNISLFKNFRKNWNMIDLDNIYCYRKNVKIYFIDSEIEAILKFYCAELKTK